jgi:hypothetical protein
MDLGPIPGRQALTVIFEGECFPEKAVWEAPGGKRPAVFRLHLYVRPAYVIREWNETGMPQMPRT